MCETLTEMYYRYVLFFYISAHLPTIPRLNNLFQQTTTTSLSRHESIICQNNDRVGSRWNVVKIFISAEWLVLIILNGRAVMN